MPLYVPASTSTAGEKAAEEAELRRQQEAELAKLEAQSKAQLEADIQKQKAAALAAFEQGLTAQKPNLQQIESTLRAKYATELATRKSELKQLYEAQIGDIRRQFGIQTEAAIREAKRREAMTVGRQLLPSVIRAYRKGEKESFESMVESATAVYEKQLAEAETTAKEQFETELASQLKDVQSQASEWEKTERGRVGAELSAWEAQVRTGYAAEVKTWKAGEQAKFETFIQEWSAAWRPKGVAERLLAWKVPDLPSFHVELFKVPLKGGALAIGLDVDKFLEGLAKGGAVAAAGVSASAESLVYTVAEYAGVKTPARPPTLSSALIGTGIGTIGSAVMGKPELVVSPEFEQVEQLVPSQYRFTYAASTLLGDVLLSYGMGKAVEKGVVEPLSKTRIGQYVGYEFKVHAPKPLLRLVYGKAGAEYIVKERLPYTLAETTMVTPSGETISQVFKLPKGEGLTGEAYLKDVFITEGAGAESFPLIRTRGATITPMRTTLSKAIASGTKRLATETKASAQILAPLETVQRIVSPTLPTLAESLQFGVVPLTETLPVGAGLATALGIKAAAQVKAQAVAAPALRPVERLKRAELSIPSLSSIVGQVPFQEVMPAQIPMQAVAQAPVQATLQKQLQQLKLDLKLKQKTKEEALPSRKRKAVEWWQRRGRLLEYPVRPTKEVPSYILGGLGRRQQKPSRVMNLQSSILGKRKTKRRR